MMRRLLDVLDRIAGALEEANAQLHTLDRTIAAAGTEVATAVDELGKALAAVDREPAR